MMNGPDFTGKITVITGAGRGLGAAFAVILADLGADVIMTGRNTEQVTTAAEAIGLRTGKRPQTIIFDPADPSQVTLNAKQMRGGRAKIDILISKCAQWLPGRMDEHDAYAIVGTIASGVTGTLLFTRGLIK